VNAKLRLATVWLDGCSGCHMSFLDMDERLLELAAQVDLVYSPLVDVKEFPADVDVTLVEGAVSSQEDERRIHQIRARTRLLVSLGDCAVTANVPSMRNPFGVDAIMRHAYLDNALLQPQIPSQDLPPLLPRVRPVHAVVPVEVFIPGCPPSADTIHFALSELLAGRRPEFGSGLRFG
jgi:NAD-reducing hydrogenase small subunit